MKKIRKIAVEQNFAAISVGKLNELNEYELQLGPDVKIPGKVFCSTALGTTGSEFSFQSFAPGTETGFLHSHKSHEELYFFLSGKGEFQVDGTVFPVKKVALSGYLLQENEVSVTTERLRSSCSAYNIAAIHSHRRMPLTESY